MAETPFVEVSSGVLRSVFSGLSDEAKVSQTVTRAVFNFPTEAVIDTSARVRVVSENSTTIRVPTALLRVITRGRTANPHIRVWTYTLDNHDFYVVRLGGLDKTLVYDTLSKMWYIWGSGETNLWRAYTGINWIAGRRHGLNSSGVITGDDGTGTLYFLSPDDDTDDDALVGDTTPRPFDRTLVGQILVEPGYASTPCFDVQLQGSVGSGAEDDLTVTLETSDDRGNTYVDRGSLEVDADAYDTRLSWRSLGSMTNPGRMFRITDSGALKRIDWMEVL